MRKICKICNIEKDVSEYRLKTNKKKNYSYYLNYCKECEKEKNLQYQKMYNSTHKEQIKKYNQKRYEDNKEKILERNTKYNKEHKEKLKEYRDKNKEKSKKYREANKSKIKGYNNKYYVNNKEELLEKEKIYKRNKRKEDDLYKFKEQIRNCINNSFRRKGNRKEASTEEIVGCTINELIEHLLYTFKENYEYEWDGKEKVHIDHICPLNVAKTKEEVISLCNYKNLQLLKEKDNLQKSCKINV